MPSWNNEILPWPKRFSNPGMPDCRSFCNALYAPPKPFFPPLKLELLRIYDISNVPKPQLH